ncbi:MAG: hypothetical protein PWP65_752 [Clostridia bacterium]|nr:hypothetical protein [Clostridia bacterium]
MMELHLMQRAPLKSPLVENLSEAIGRELARMGAAEKIRPGSKIAVTAGSRGLARYPEILRTVVAWVKERGGKPFLVPAMGSHGGGTAEGRLNILARLGITADGIGAPIEDGEDVVEVGRVAGIPVYTDGRAAAADGIILLNRVKPHTAFHGHLESGLVKMLVVGLGKVQGADAFHTQPPSRLARTLEQMGSLLLERLPVIGGLALIENAEKELALVEGLSRNEILKKEPELLKQARELMPRLPFTGADILIIDEMGKNFSGTGMDTNIIGRYAVEGLEDAEEQPAKRIFVRDLSRETEGNANGVGLADFITERLARAIDRRATYLNALTTGFIRRAMLPLIFATDREALEAAAQSLKKRLEDCSLGWIRNTLHLGEILVSADLVKACREAGYSETKTLPLNFGPDGNLITPWDGGGFSWKI